MVRLRSGECHAFRSEVSTARSIQTRRLSEGAKTRVLGQFPVTRPTRQVELLPSSLLSAQRRRWSLWLIFQNQAPWPPVSMIPLVRLPRLPGARRLVPRYPTIRQGIADSGDCECNGDLSPSTQMAVLKRRALVLHARQSFGTCHSQTQNRMCVSMYRRRVLARMRPSN